MPMIDIDWTAELHRKGVCILQSDCTISVTVDMDRGEISDWEIEAFTFTESFSTTVVLDKPDPATGLFFRTQTKWKAVMIDRTTDRELFLLLSDEFDKPEQRDKFAEKVAAEIADGVDA